jgi:hypothetical protein
LAVSYTIRAAFAEGIPTVAAVLTAVSHLASSDGCAVVEVNGSVCLAAFGAFVVGIRAVAPFAVYQKKSAT